MKELRCQLREAELAGAVGGMTVILHRIHDTGESLKARLGLTPRTTKQVDGVTAVALVDTRSSVTIISLDLARRVLVKNRSETQTPAQWRDTALEKFKSPEIALTSYGGNHLELIAQFPVQLMQGRRSIDIVVLGQKGAPNDVLLGTDVQAQLGFSFIVERSDQESIDLLVGERDMAVREQVGNGGPGETGTAARMKKRGPPNGDLQVEEGHRAEGGMAGEGTTEERSERDVMKDQIPKAAPEVVRRDGNPTRPDSNDKQVDGAHYGSVHLLQGVRIRPGCQKMVQAKVSRELGKGLMLFTPKLEESNVLMAESVVEVGEETYVTLVMQNYNLQPVQLQGEVQLGKLTPIEVVAREKRYVGGGHQYQETGVYD